MDEYRADRSLSTVSNIIPLPNENINPIRDHLQCPLCIFAASSRPEFTEHLIGHYTPKQCNNANSLKAILAHLPVFKSLLNSDSDSCLSFTLSTEHETEEPVKSSFGASATNSQNKSLSSVRYRGFREAKSCKQCNFIARTKMEYWEHMRYHIKGFTCSECSFITKYKHHMNHHWLSVHDGSKPFKCKKCLYTCVSKSMLTSHLKKHSNVYPYRCADCAYKTKFCNALKKHLRKKEHQPAMMLNADGSPNPLTVIDVYGTKRGPKQKSASVRERDETESNVATTSSTDNHHSAVSTTSPLSPSSSFRSPVARYLTVTAINGVNNGHWINQNVGVNMNHAAATFPYSDLVAAFNLSSHVSPHEDTKTSICENVQKTDYADGFDTTLMEYAKISNTEDKMTKMFAQGLPVTHFNAINNVIGKYHHSSDSTEATSESSTTFMAIKSTQLKYQKAESDRADVPLDLRMAKVIGKKQLQLQTLARISANLPKITKGTSKRKGKAIKFERRYGTMVKATGTDDDQEPERKWEDVSFESLPIESRAGSSLRQGNQRGKDIKNEAVVDLFDVELTCHYCQIIFANVIMYVVHMGCHSFHDPYTCSICGQRCIDKLSFFLHIARSKH